MTIRVTIKSTALVTTMRFHTGNDAIAAMCDELADRVETVKSAERADERPSGSR
jgi:hypothetical protein